MARSMTAYGRAHIKTSVGAFQIEIHSVNRKSLDIHSNIPKEFLILDMDFRKRLTQEVKRGNVTLRITKESGHGPFSDIPSPEAMKEVHEEWMKRASVLGYDPKEAIPFTSLMQLMVSSTPSVQKVDESLKEKLMEGLDEACKAFTSMKETEGKALVEDILPRLDEIAKGISFVQERGKEAPERYRKKLEKRLEELNLNHEGDEDRIAREMVLFADRIDVTEEMIRLNSHIEQFREILAQGKKRVGRELDFLTQEMNREVNTSSAKSQDLEMTQKILFMKSEIDKIREQLQNIE
ncbi:MAG: YicC family protein [Chlamydiia bacterium]|nr:YicC family protein [Chlamydiia bacterium]